MKRPKDTESVHLPWFAQRRGARRLTVTVCIVIFFMAIWLSLGYHRQAESRALAEDRTEAKLVAAIVYGYIRGLLSTMQAYSSRPLLVRAVADRDEERAWLHLAHMKQFHPETDILVLTDAKGTVLLAVPTRPESVDRNFSHRDWYRGVRRYWQPFVSNVLYRITGEKDPAVQIAVPILDPAGKPRGVLVATQRTKNIGTLVDPLHERTVGKTITVTDGVGNVVYGRRFPYDTTIVSYPHLRVMEQYAADPERSYIIDDSEPGGGRRYLSVAPVGGWGWHCFVEREVLSLVKEESVYYLQIWVIALLSAFLTFYFVSSLRRRVMEREAVQPMTAERELRASENRFRQLFDNMASGVTVYRAVREGDDFVIVDINAAGKRITGSSDEVIGRRVTEVFPGVKDFGLLAVFREVWRTGNTMYHPVNLYCYDRLTFWAENWVYRLPTGEVVAVFDDVTERKKAEERIAGQMNLLAAINRFLYRSLGVEDEYATMCLCLSEAVAITGSLRGIVGKLEAGGEVAVLAVHGSGGVSVEPTAGISPKETVYLRGPWGGVISCGRSLVRNSLSGPSPGIEVIEGGRPVESFLAVPLRNREKEFGVLVVVDNTAGYTDEHVGHLETLASIMVEVIRREEAEASLRKINRDLEQRIEKRTALLDASNRELETFCYSVSHDLRAPLRAIDGFSQILIENCGPRLHHEETAYLERIRSAAQNMGHLIDGLLKLSRVMRAEFQWESVDLSAMAREILSSYAQLEGERGVVWVVQSGLVVEGDTYLLQAVMRNLLENAWKYTSRTTAARIEVGMEEQKGNKVYFVRDNGVGFDMAYLDKMFNPFQRLHRPDDFPGMGIGLATVMRIIARHGGRVWAEGETGRGATFYFTLS